MKAVGIFAFIVAMTADFVPNAGPYLALVASTMAVYGFPASAKMGVATILYGILGTLIYSPGFILSDVATGNFGGAATGNADVDAISSAVGALATGTVPNDMIVGAGYEPLSAALITLLVTLHMVALIAGFRHKARVDAEKTRAEEDYDFE